MTRKVCLIAGASGAIGQAVASRFHQSEFRLALGYRRTKPHIEGWANFDCDTTLVQFDISKSAEVNQAVDAVIARFGKLDCVVNCTGILGPVGNTSNVAPDEWVRAIQVNLIGSFYLTHAVLPIMKKNAYGKIIHFSGGGAAYGRPFYTAYSASKAALVRFCESLAEEVRSSHIDINAVAPGSVNSSMWQAVRDWKDPDQKTRSDLARMDATGGVPPERASELAFFLASARSDGLSGRLISAVWDKWEALGSSNFNWAASEAGTLRRIPFV